MAINNNHLIVMALVGVVAVAGLVFLQQGTPTGMATQNSIVGRSCYFNAMNIPSNTRCEQIPGTTDQWMKVQCRYPGVWMYTSVPYADSKCRFYTIGNYI